GGMEIEADQLRMARPRPLDEVLSVAPGYGRLAGVGAFLRLAGDCGPHRDTEGGKSGGGDRDSHPGAVRHGQHSCESVPRECNPSLNRPCRIPEFPFSTHRVTP